MQPNVKRKTVSYMLASGVDKMMIECIMCGDAWHISWAKKWSVSNGDFIHVPADEFVCLKCGEFR